MRGCLSISQSFAFLKQLEFYFEDKIMHQRHIEQNRQPEEPSLSERDEIDFKDESLKILNGAIVHFDKIAWDKRDELEEVMKKLDELVGEYSWMN